MRNREPRYRLIRVIHVFLFVLALLPMRVQAQTLPWTLSVCLPCEDCEPLRAALSTTTADLRSLEVRCQRALEFWRWRALEAEDANRVKALRINEAEAELAAEQADGFPWVPVLIGTVAVFAGGVAFGIWVDKKL